ncbi:MAG: hypothetical protein QXI09_00810 [Candidatus Aenigmatarchaeota archaeon]
MGGVSTVPVFLIAGVIIVGIALYIIFTSSRHLLSEIFSFLGFEKKPTSIESAVLCSLYRCTYGCMSAEVEKISWREDGKLVKCKDFCNNIPEDTYEDKNMKTVCSPNFPVSINLKKNERLGETLSKLISVGNKRGLDCLLVNSELFEKALVSATGSAPLLILSTKIILNAQDSVVSAKFPEGDCTLYISPIVSIPLGQSHSFIEVSNGQRSIITLRKVIGSTQYFLIKLVGA